jgi:hypothetical protein
MLHGAEKIAHEFDPAGHELAVGLEDAKPSCWSD